MELNKKKMTQEKMLLNEIQTRAIIFTIDGFMINVNHKAKIFLKTRGIKSTDKLLYYEIFPNDCHERVKNLFNASINGKYSEEEFIISHELDSIPPPFSSVILSFKKIEYDETAAIEMTVADIGIATMRRRYLSSNQRSIEENSMILEEQFLESYFNRQPLKNKHMKSLNRYLLSQRDLLILIDNYLGKCEVISDYFDLKNEIINTVHIR